MVSAALTYVFKRPIDPLNSEVDEKEKDSKFLKHIYRIHFCCPCQIAQVNRESSIFLMK